MNSVCVLFVQPHGNVQILFWGFFFAEMQSEIIQHILLTQHTLLYKLTHVVQHKLHCMQ